MKKLISKINASVCFTSILYFLDEQILLVMFMAIDLRPENEHTLVFGCYVGLHVHALCRLEMGIAALYHQAFLSPLLCYTVLSFFHSSY